jgi:hypothetical protein
MSQPSNVVSLHPYFTVHPGKLDAAKALLPEFVKISSTESKSLYYDFTINGDMIFCREAYIGADGVLEHLGNVGALLDALLKMADLTRIELHGPADELEKLKAPFAALNPTWFVYECGVVK